MQLVPKLMALEPRRKRALASVAALLLPARAMVRLSSFERARATAHGLAPRLVGPFRDAPDPGAEIAWAIAGVRRGLRTSRSCVAESIVAEALARAAGVPTSVMFGFRRDEKGALTGHAWAQSSLGPIANPAEAEPFSLILRAPGGAERRPGSRRYP